MLAKRHAQLQGQQLIELEPFSSALERVGIRREVDRPNRLVFFHQTLAGQRVGGQRVGYRTERLEGPKD